MAAVSIRTLGLALLLLLLTNSVADGVPIPAGLRPQYYRRSCPQFPSIVLSTIHRNLRKDVQIAAHLLRLLFHDAVVNGVDASVMIDSTPTNSGEKDALPNRSLDGFTIIDDIKAQLEAVCPGTVSCADILVLSVRDAVYLRDGPFYPVYLGRKDGRVSSLSAAIANNPSPNSFADKVLASFSGLGLGVADAVALSGAHTIGKAGCRAFGRRLTNFNGTGLPDPTIPPSYLAQILANCSVSTFRVDNDPLTPNVFDNQYYVDLLASRGLFQSDQYLLFDPRTKPYVLKFAASQRAFFSQFSASIFALSNVGVLTGPNGEVRTNCRVVNPLTSPPADPFSPPPPGPSAASFPPPPPPPPPPSDSTPPPAPPVVDATPPATLPPPGATPPVAVPPVDATPPASLSPVGAVPPVAVPPVDAIPPATDASAPLPPA